MARYITQEEGYYWETTEKGHKAGMQDIHAKKYEFFEVLDERRYDEAIEEAHETGDWPTEWELVEQGILEEPLTLFRDGWGGKFFEITDAWSSWEDDDDTFHAFYHDGQFSNGTSGDEFDGLPPFKVVTLEEYDGYSRGVTPVFW